MLTVVIPRMLPTIPESNHEEADSQYDFDQAPEPTESSPLFISPRRRRYLNYPYSSSSNQHQSYAKPSGIPIVMGISVLIAATFIFLAMWMDPEWFETYHISIRNIRFQMVPKASQFPIREEELSLVHLHSNATNNTTMTPSSSSSSTLPPPQLPKERCEGTILIMRHCESSFGSLHCSYAGMERAAYLATLFGTTVDDDTGIVRKARWPAPSFIYAVKPGHTRNYRAPVETVQAVADKFHLPIHSQFGAGKIPELANHLMKQVRTGSICGKLILISWKHQRIASLAQKLGNEYDAFFFGSQHKLCF